VKPAGSGKGGAQKCALIESLRKIYSTDTVEAADKLVCGIMGLEATATQDKSETKAIIVNTLPRQNKAGDRKVESQGENSYKNSPVQRKNREAAENLSPVPSSHSLRNLALILVAALSAGGIWESTRISSPEAKVDINQPSSVQSVLPSKANWDVCRAAQDIRQPTSTPGENTKPLRDGLGRFSPPANTKQEETWWKYRCSEIPGIYDW
jgi:hypothetical protein